jgi:hypothetical protein
MADRLSNAQLEAVAFLESVYATALAGKDGARIIDALPRWVDPDNNADAYYKVVRESEVSDTVQNGSLAGSIFGLERKIAYYKQQLLAIMPAIAQQARSWARSTLDGQELRVGSIANVVAARGEQLAAACRAVVELVSGKTFQLPTTTPDEAKHITGEKGRSGTVGSRLRRVEYTYAIRKLRMDVEGAGRAGASPPDQAAADATVYRYLALLMAHPRGVDIVNRFKASKVEGAKYALETISDCTASIRGTRVDLGEDAIMIWRFPPAITAGVASLGLARTPAITRFALAWGRNQKSSLDSGLEVAGNAIFSLSLLGGGFAAASDVLDLALSVVQLAVTFVRDLEQDQAANASAFADEAEKLSSGARTVGDLLKGATAIVVSIAVPEIVSAVAQRVARRGVEAAEAAAHAAPHSELLHAERPRDLPDAKAIASAAEDRAASAAQKKISERGIDPTKRAIGDAERTAASEERAGLDKLTGNPGTDQTAQATAGPSRVRESPEPLSASKVRDTPEPPSEAPKGPLDPPARGTTVPSKAVEEPPGPGHTTPSEPKQRRAQIAAQPESTPKAKQKAKRKKQLETADAEVGGESTGESASAGDKKKSDSKSTTGKETTESKGVNEPGTGAPEARPKPTTRKDTPQPPGKTEDPIPGLGGGDTYGRLNVYDNDNVPKLTGVSKLSKAPLYKKYESAFVQNYLKPFVEKLSAKRVARTYVGQKGRGSASSGITNQVKTQKRLVGEEVIRRPDAYLETVSKSRGKVEEAHFFEATLQSDFEAELGFAGHKQSQISGTAWLATKVPRTNFTGETKVYYHIFCPDHPSNQTKAFLNSVIADNPGLEINWIVLKPE